MAAKRKSKSRSRSRSPKSFNITNAAEAYILGSAVTQGLFGTTLFNFATEGWLRDKSPATAGGAGNSWSISASELLMSMAGDNSHMSTQWQGMGGVGAAIKKNLKDNGARSLMTLVFVPIAFRGVKRLAGKPIRMVNRVLPKGTVKV